MKLSSFGSKTCLASEKQMPCSLVNTVPKDVHKEQSFPPGESGDWYILNKKGFYVQGYADDIVICQLQSLPNKLSIVINKLLILITGLQTGIETFMSHTRYKRLKKENCSLSPPIGKTGYYIVV